MNILKTAGAIAVTALALGGSLGAVPASASTPQTYVYGSGYHNSGFSNPRQRPKMFLFGTGGNLRLRSIHWSRWGTRTARGQGVREYCDLYSCSRERATVILSVPKVHVTQTGRRVTYFSHMGIHWNCLVDRFTYGRAGGTVVFWH